MTPLLPEIRAPDPFIIQKSRQLNKRVTLNVGGVRHDVLWKMLEQVKHIEYLNAIIVIRDWLGCEPSNFSFKSFIHNSFYLTKVLLTGATVATGQTGPGFHSRGDSSAL